MTSDSGFVMLGLLLVGSALTWSEPGRGGRQVCDGASSQAPIRSVPPGRCTPWRSSRTGRQIERRTPWSYLDQSQTGLSLRPMMLTDLALGLGAVRPAGLRHHLQQGRQVDPLGGQDGVALAARTNAESDVAVGQNLARPAAQILQAAEQTLEGGGSSLVGGEANRRRPAEAQDGDHRAQLDHLVAQREEPEPGPVGLGLETRSGLETNLGVLDLGRPEQAEVALKGRVAARVAVLVPELGMQVGAPDAGAGAEAAFDVDPLGLVELGRLGAAGATRAGAGELLIDRCTAQTVLAGQGGDRPPQPRQGFQFHRRFSRLHGGVLLLGRGL